jgi:transposase InsO family protein
VGTGFCLDQLDTGRRFRVLAIYDVCTRRCLRAVVDFSLSGKRVARELNAVIAANGKPNSVGSDNGTELTSNAIIAWTAETGVNWHYIDPGKPIQNAFIDSFNYAETFTATGQGSALRALPRCSTRDVRKLSDSSNSWIKSRGKLTHNRCAMWVALAFAC